MNELDFFLKKKDQEILPPLPTISNSSLGSIYSLSGKYKVGWVVKKKEKK